MSELTLSHSFTNVCNTLADIAPSILANLRKQYLISGVPQDTPRLTLYSAVEMNSGRHSDLDFIKFFKEEVYSCSCTISIPHLFLLHNEEGHSIDLCYPDQLRPYILDKGLREGISFSLDHLGINATSLAMQFNTTFLVKGAEHDLNIFSVCNSLCTPIRISEQAVGYLTFCFPHHYNTEFASALLYILSRNIEKKLLKNNSEYERSILFNTLSNYGLTDREKEAAHGWLSNKSAAQIASEMSITVESYRNLIKQVYKKTNIHDKGAFFKNFGSIV